MSQSLSPTKILLGPGDLTKYIKCNKYSTTRVLCGTVDTASSQPLVMAAVGVRSSWRPFYRCPKLSAMTALSPVLTWHRVISVATLAVRAWTAACTAHMLPVMARAPASTAVAMTLARAPALAPAVRATMVMSAPWA